MPAVTADGVGVKQAPTRAPAFASAVAPTGSGGEGEPRQTDGGEGAAGAAAASRTSF